MGQPGGTPATRTPFRVNFRIAIHSERTCKFSLRKNDAGVAGRVGMLAPAIARKKKAVAGCWEWCCQSNRRRKRRHGKQNGSARGGGRSWLAFSMRSGRFALGGIDRADCGRRRGHFVLRLSVPEPEGVWPHSRGCSSFGRASQRLTRWAIGFRPTGLGALEGGSKLPPHR
jgi:hypothetical protein